MIQMGQVKFTEKSFQLLFSNYKLSRSYKYLDENNDRT